MARIICTIASALVAIALTGAPAHAQPAAPSGSGGHDPADHLFQA